MLKSGATLAFFAAIFTSLIALTNYITEPIINKQIIKQQQLLFDQIIPANFYDNELKKDCYIVQTELLGKGKHHIYIARNNKIPVGVIMEITASDGYSGDIKILSSSNFSGTVLGARVIQHHETPGLGDKIELRLSDWILNFSGKTIHGVNDSSFAIKKDGGEFDQFTGATITPRAVVNAIKYATLYAKTLPEQLSMLTVCEN